MSMRAYVITESTPDVSVVTNVMTSKQQAIKTCEETLGPDGTWESKEKPGKT